MFSNLPPLRRVGMSALFAFCCAVLLVTLFGGLSPMYGVRLMQIGACVLPFIVVVSGVIATITGKLANYTEVVDDDDFELRVHRSEQLAPDNVAAEPDETDFIDPDPRSPHDVDEPVREVTDNLPDL